MLQLPKKTKAAILCVAFLFVITRATTLGQGSLVYSGYVGQSLGEFPNLDIDQDAVVDFEFSQVSTPD